MTKQTITIDLNPYELEIEGSIAILKDAPMDLTIPERWRNRIIPNGPDVGEARFQGLYCGDDFYFVEQDGNDWRLTRPGGPISVHHVVDVVRANFDAIIDLGWEALKP